MFQAVRAQNGEWVVLIDQAWLPRRSYIKTENNEPMQRLYQTTER
jgi:hypothetical protein